MFKRKKKRSREFKNSDKVIDIEQARAARRSKRKLEQEKKANRTRRFAPEPQSERKANQRNRKTLVYCGAILFIVVILGFSIFNVYSVKKEYEKTLAEHNALLKTKEDLQEELKHVNEPDYIEQQAREQLKMVKPGEVMYILPQAEGEGTVVSTEGSMNLLPAGDMEH